ncbi:hypothetical protein [Massilia eurypsychrophila]|nr:hypothetical protein [Massilia eurypsychrophila]
MTEHAYQVRGRVAKGLVTARADRACRGVTKAGMVTAGAVKQLQRVTNEK